MKNACKKGVTGCTLLSAMIAALLSLPAQAEVRFNGFASIRAASADSDGGPDPWGDYKGNGDISFKDDSLFGLQASSDLGEGLTATVQLIAEGRDDFNVDARWAYLNYEINDTHQISVGRVANPIFYQSQYEKVGYAHHFGRLPRSVYQIFPFNTLEGMTLDSTFFVGNFTLETKLVYGNWDGDLALAGTSVPFELKDEVGFNAVLSQDWWRLFAGYLQAETGSSQLDLVLASQAQTGIAGALALGATQADVDRFLTGAGTDGKDSYYFFYGLDIDYGDWMIDLESVKYGIDDSIYPDAKAYYFSVGYRFGNSVLTVHVEDYKQETDYGFLSGVSHPVLIATGQGVQQALASSENDGVGVTWRYDFHPSAALKMEWVSGEDVRSAIGDYDVLSVGVDLVF